MNKKYLAVFLLVLTGLLPLFAGTNLKNCTFDLQSNVKNFSDEGITDNIRNGVRYQPSPMDLNVGDIFIDADGCAKKVVQITIKGNNMTIDTIPVRNPYDVLQFANIPPQTIEPELFSIIPENCVSYETMEPENNRTRSILDTGLFSKLMSNVSGSKVKFNVWTNGTPDKNPVYDPSKAKEFPSKLITLELGYKARKNRFSVSPSFSLPYVRHYGPWYKVWQWESVPGHGQINMDVDFEVILGFEVGFVGQLGESIPIIGSPALSSGVYAGWYLEPILKASISLNTQFYFRNVFQKEVGIKFEGLGPLMVPTSTINKTLKEGSARILNLEGKLTGDFEVGAPIKIGLRAVGINIVELYAGGGLYSTASAPSITYTRKKIEGCISGDSMYNNVKDGWSGNLSDWKLDAGGFVRVKLSAINNKLSATLIDKRFSILN